MTAVSIFDVTEDMIRPLRPYILQTPTDRQLAELLAMPMPTARPRETVGKLDSYGVPEREAMRTTRRYCTRCGISFARCPSRGRVCADCVGAP